jgi:hypothetical protein
MFKLFKSWRSLRWLAFLLSLAIDGYAFYISQPLTPESFQTSGIIAILLFLIFLEIALQMRGQGRIKAALDDKEKIAYQVGQHLVVLLRTIRENRLARRAIWIPVSIAAATTLFWIGWAVWKAGGDDHAWLDATYALLPDNRYAFAGYLPLILAIPFVLEYVSEWRSHQYVLVVDKESLDPRLLIHAGVLMYDLETVSLERTVTTHVQQTFSDTLIALGDVELRETAGGEGEKLSHVWRPRRLAKQIQRAISRRRRLHANQAD